jgi:hypothetical protein
MEVNMPGPDASTVSIFHSAAVRTPTDRVMIAASDRRLTKVLTFFKAVLIDKTSLAVWRYLSG